MQQKPAHFDTRYAEAFKEQSVVDAYRYRPPYPDEVFRMLAGLVTDEPRSVLDVGAGSGDIARGLVEFVERVDAIDFSQAMIERGKRLPRGDSPHLRWIYGKVEETPLTPPYALITAGSSIHWMDWDRAFPRFRSVLTPNGLLALVYRRVLPHPWNIELQTLRGQFSTGQGQGHRSAQARKELEARGLFSVRGQKETAPVSFVQSVDDFIEGLHSRSGFTRERIGQQQASDFDEQARSLLLTYYPDGSLPLQVIGTVIWGTPSK